MDSARDSIRRMLLSLLTLFSLGITPCFTGTGHSRLLAAELDVRDEIASVIEDIRHQKRSLSYHLAINESFEKLEAIANEESFRVRSFAERKLPYEYGAYNSATKLIFEDCALLLAHIKRQIVEGNDYLAKKRLLEFVEALEQKDIGCDTKILNFYTLFLKTGGFYSQKLTDFGFCVRGPGPEGYCSAEAVRNYHAQQDKLDESFRLTLQFMSAFVYILFSELNTLTPAHTYAPLRRSLHNALSYCYTVLGPIMCPRFPATSYAASLTGETGCSGGAGVSRARASTASDYSSEGISDLSDEDDKTPAKSTSRLFSQFLPKYSLS